MLTGANLRDPVLINTIGHAAGLLLFGVIIALLIRDRRAHGNRQTGLSLVAATLALAWNVGSLIALASHNPASITAVMTASFAVLSFLPAVLLQVALQGRQRFILTAGYGVSACAAVLHFSELFSSSAAPHQAALVVIATGFDVLTISAFLVRQRRYSNRASDPAEWFSLACLLLFTSSFLHFGYQHVSSPWTAEIAWHHIGIPVALIVLLQDYRFLLLDTFARFLLNFALAIVYIGFVLVTNDRFQILQRARWNMFGTGLVLIALCLSLILFAHARNILQSWMATVIFRRQNLDDCVRRLAKSASDSESEDVLLHGAAREVAAHLRTDQFALVGAGEGMGPDEPSVLFNGQQRACFPAEVFWAEAQVPLRFSRGDVHFLLTGPRRGGQRYLSQDLEDMRRLASAIVEQVERFRSEELKRLATQAELRALQAQINPHFLFNALNTLYGTIDRHSHEARRMVLNLADIFRYFLQGDRTLIALAEELRIVEAYLEIEALRLGDRLETDLSVSEGAKSAIIPILSIQPLIENAVKHGIAAKIGKGRVGLRAEKTGHGIRVTVEDTGEGFNRQMSNQERIGMGLENVRRRLKLCYGAEADLDIRSSQSGTSVSFLIPEVAGERPANRRIEVQAF